jgi:hypothetical protein
MILHHPGISRNYDVAFFAALLIYTYEFMLPRDIIILKNKDESKKSKGMTSDEFNLMQNSIRNRWKPICCYILDINDDAKYIQLCAKLCESVIMNGRTVRTRSIYLELPKYARSCVDILFYSCFVDDGNPFRKAFASKNNPTTQGVIQTKIYDIHWTQLYDRAFNFVDNCTLNIPLDINRSLGIGLILHILRHVQIPRHPLQGSNNAYSHDINIAQLSKMGADVTPSSFRTGELAFLQKHVPMLLNESLRNHIAQNLKQKLDAYSQDKPLVQNVMV